MNACKCGGGWVLIPTEYQEIGDGQIVQLAGDPGMLADAVQGIAENDGLAEVSVKEWLHPKRIACAEDTPLRSVPHRKGEVAQQVIDTIFVPDAIGS